MRCIRARAHLRLKKKGRKGYIAKTVFKLVKFVHTKLKKAADNQLKSRGAKSLQIIIKYRDEKARLIIDSTNPDRLRTYKRTIPLYHPAHPEFLFIQFWHQLSKRALLLQVTNACKLIPRKIFASAQYISFEAKDFMSCRPGKYIIEPPILADEEPTLEKENLYIDELQVMGGHETFETDYIDSINEYIPDFDQYSDFVYGKIPLKRSDPPPTATTTDIVKKSPDEKTKKKMHIPKSITFHKQPNNQRAIKMRQTRIEEFFKPRAHARPNSKEDCATSCAAIQNRGIEMERWANLKCNQ